MSRPAQLHAVDMNGLTFSAGDRVRAWWDGTEYEGVVEEVRPHVPGEGYTQPVLIRRDSDGAQMEAASAQVAVIR